MASCMPGENWLKGMLGVGITKDAIIPFLEEHYKQTYEEWNNGDSHLQHLLDLAAKGYLKQTKGEGGKWEVNCCDCKPVLEKLMTSHRVPKRLMWMNNTDQVLNVSNEYRLPKVYMASGNADSSNFNDRDALAILEVCRNDERLDISSEAFVLILFRNRLVHSSDNCITEEEMTGAFDKMKELLRNDKLRNRDECIAALKKLDELLEKPMMCEIDESNEIWKMAISIKDMALQKESTLVNPEALKVLLERTKDQLQREQHQRQSAESTLATSQIKLNDVLLELQKNKKEMQLEKERADCTRNNLELERNQRAKEKNDYEDKERRLLEENRKLNEEVEEMERYNPSLAGRIAKGSATGTVVGIAGGPVGLAVGGAAGGVVGGISYFWDKFTGK